MRLLFTGILLLVGCSVFSQNNVLKFTDYSVARPLINPAVMGVEEGTSGLLLYRSRFEKTDYWPSLGAFNINSSLKDKNVGGGLTLMYDKYGPYQKVFGYAAGSYKLKVNEGKYLFFGIQGGINYVTNEGNYKKNDEEEVISTENYSQPNFGFGLHFKTDKFYAGFSIPEFMYNTIDQNGVKINDMASEMLKMYLYGGYKFTLTPNTKLEPYLCMYYSEEEDMQLDLGAKLAYKESLLFGFQYRTKESFAVMAQVKLMEDLWLGYAFEGNNSDVDNNFNSVQEISLVFRFGKKSKKESKEDDGNYDENINSIRYF